MPGPLPEPPGCVNLQEVESISPLSELTNLWLLLLKGPSRIPSAPLNLQIDAMPLRHFLGPCTKSEVSTMKSCSLTAFWLFVYRVIARNKWSPAHPTAATLVTTIP